MTQWTDVPFTITVPGVNFSTASGIHVTIKQKPDVFLDLSGERVQVLGESALFVELTQTESGAFNDTAIAKMKVNWLDANGKRHATKTKVLKVEENLLEEVIGVEQHHNDG